METKILAKQLGISHQLCNRLKKRGMPTDSLEVAIQWRRMNLDTTNTKEWRIDGNTGLKRSNENNSNKSFEELTNSVQSRQLDLETTNAEELYQNARALKEKALALREAAEYEKFIGELCRKEEVERAIFVRGRQFRDGLMGLCRRVAPEIMGKTSAAEIERILMDEHRNMLIEFTKLPVIE